MAPCSQVLRTTRDARGSVILSGVCAAFFGPAHALFLADLGQLEAAVHGIGAPFAVREPAGRIGAIIRVKYRGLPVLIPERPLVDEAATSHRQSRRPSALRLEVVGAVRTAYLASGVQTQRAEQARRFGAGN